MAMQPSEQQARVDLAAFYRLVADYGWDDLLLAHLSCRVPGEDAYLINPYGLLFEEITASSLLKVDYQGQKLRSSDYDISPGSQCHSWRHSHRRGRRQLRRSRAYRRRHGGCLPGWRSAQYLAAVHAGGVSLAYHDYEGVVLDPAEAPRLRRIWVSKRHMILRNHGLLTVGARLSGVSGALQSAALV